MIALLLALQAAPAIEARVDRILKRAPIVDGHNDLAWEIRKKYDARVETLDLRDATRPPYPLQTDIARLRTGRVGGQFWSVWIPTDTTGPLAVEMTLQQIDIVRRLVVAHPRDFALATTAADVRRIAREGRVARRPDRSLPRLPVGQAACPGYREDRSCQGDRRSRRRLRHEVARAASRL